MLTTLRGPAALLIGSVLTASALGQPPLPPGSPAPTPPAGVPMTPPPAVAPPAAVPMTPPTAVAPPAAVPPGLTPPAAAAPVVPEVRPTGTAATVNGQPIPEVAVYRALRQFPPTHQDAARKEIVSHLVENLLIDQYLTALKITVEEKEVDALITELKTDLEKEKKEMAKELEGMMLTEAEFRTEVAAQMRWEKFVKQQGNDDALKQLHAANPDIFDGTLVRARHVLLTPGTDTAKQAEAAQKLRAIKATVEAEAKKVMDAMPATATPAEKEQARTKRTDELFAAYAKEHSVCPSKKDGGDLNYFPRSGAMVEPFAKAAFAMKPFDMSDVVATEFGYHLIMVTERKQGTAKPFEQVKEDVRMMYAMRLREAVIAQMKPKAAIEIKPAPTTPTSTAPMTK